MADLPKLRIYDSGPDGCADRYTVVILDKEWRKTTHLGNYPMLGFNANPTHPTYGISQWTEGNLGRHLGKELGLEDLTPELQQHVRMRLAPT